MARRRYITTDISTDQRIDQLADECNPSGLADYAVKLYTWAIVHATDDARLIGTPHELLLRLTPGDLRRGRTAADVALVLRAMHELGLITWDEERNVVEFPPTSFYRHQNYIKKERRQDSANLADVREESPQNPASHSHSHSHSHSRSHSHSALPRRGARGAAVEIPEPETETPVEPETEPEPETETPAEAEMPVEAEMPAAVRALRPIVGNRAPVQFYAEIAAKFPDVDLELEAQGMAEWLQEHGKRGSRRFVVGWLERTVAAVERRPATPNRSPPDADPLDRYTRGKYGHVVRY